MRCAAGALGLAAMLCVPAGALPADAPSAAFVKWNEISQAVLAGRTLVALDTESVRVRQTPRGPVRFTYFRTDALAVDLTASRRRFQRPAFSTRMTVRTSAGSLTGSRVTADTAGHLLLSTGGTGFAGPVLWCCTAAGVEVTVESDGRPDAPRTLAAGFDGTRVRLLMRDAGGAARLVSASPDVIPDTDQPDPTRTAAAFAGVPVGRLAAVTDGTVAWVDATAPTGVRTGVPSDTGVDGVVDHPMGGIVTGVLAAPGVVVATVRIGTRSRVVRLDLTTGRLRRVWSGGRVPRVALGGGTIAIADGRRVLTSRDGAVARLAAQANGDIAAVAVDGDRVAWFQRVLRAGTRWTVARLAVVRP